nr:phage integrase SAM-like domain-containing protein [uncultured Allomuricauda sp.]
MIPNIKFYPSKEKGECKVYLRLKLGTIKDMRLSTGQTIHDATKWNPRTHLPNESSASNKKLKKNLQELENLIKQNIDGLEKDESKSVRDIEGKDIKKLIQGFNNLEPLTDKDLLVNYAEWYCKDLPKRTYKRNDVQYKLKQNTIDKYVNFNNILKMYQQHLGHEIQLTEVDEVFANDFLEYLTDIEPKSINTKGRYVKRLKTIIKDAQLKGCKVNPKYSLIKGFQDENIVTYLTFDEIDDIIQAEMPNERLEIAKDWFIIACYTAQRISDLHRFSKKNIQTIQGGRYIAAKQFKTNKNLEIPIHYKVEKVLKKYKDNFPPKFTENEQSQRSMLSTLIKEVCRIAGIKDKEYGRFNGVKGTYPKYKLVSNHTGRRSFACNFYNLPNWSVQEIMNITGHDNEKNFLTYIDKSDPTLSRNARNKFDEMERMDKERKPQLEIIKRKSN